MQGAKPINNNSINMGSLPSSDDEVIAIPMISQLSADHDVAIDSDEDNNLNGSNSAMRLKFFDADGQSPIKKAIESFAIND